MDGKISINYIVQLSIIIIMYHALILTLISKYLICIKSRLVVNYLFVQALYYQMESWFSVF